MWQLDFWASTYISSSPVSGGGMKRLLLHLEEGGREGVELLMGPNDDDEGVFHNS